MLRLGPSLDPEHACLPATPPGAPPHEEPIPLTTMLRRALAETSSPTPRPPACSPSLLLNPMPVALPHTAQQTTVLAKSAPTARVYPPTVADSNSYPRPSHTNHHSAHVTPWQRVGLALSKRTDVAGGLPGEACLRPLQEVRDEWRVRSDDAHVVPTGVAAVVHNLIGGA